MRNRLSFVLLSSASILFSGCSKEEPVVEISAGEQIFKSNCKVCHAQGINGAPIVGNNAMWDERAAQGIDVLVEHAANGYGLMPAKGGNDALSEEELREAITYMLNQL